MKKRALLLMAVVACGTMASAQAPAIPAAEQEAIIATALDYGDGFYAGAPERMERAIHPDLNKVFMRALPQTGNTVVGYSTYSGLIEMTRAKVGLTAPEKRKIQGYALAMNGDIACAKVTSAMFDDYLSMIKVDGQWKIVNVLWTPGPDTPNRPPVPVVDAVKDGDSITRAAEDFVLGGMAGDADRVARVLHPEVSMAVLGMVPTGRSMINRQGYSSVVESARAKLSVAPEGARAAEVRIIDVMDGMAFVEITTANLLIDAQMALLDGQWTILNVLAKRVAPPR